MIVSTLGFAQNTEINVNTGIVPGIDSFDLNRKFEGTPYLYRDWTTGSVVLKNSRSYPDQLLKYDMYRDELIAQQLDTKKMILVPTKNVASFSLLSDGDDTLHFRNIHNAYYQVLCRGSATLLAKHSKYLLKADKVKGALSTQSTDEFKLKNESFFVLLYDQDLTSLKTNKKSIASIFPNHTEPLKNYIKEHALDLKDAKDLIKLIEYYNALADGQ